jgi:hypothetical protein
MNRKPHRLNWENVSGQYRSPLVNWLMQLADCRRSWTTWTRTNLRLCDVATDQANYVDDVMSLAQQLETELEKLSQVENQALADKE